jgi:transposase-like protein
MNQKPTEPERAAEKPSTNEEAPVKRKKNQPAKKSPAKKKPGKKPKRYSALEKARIIRSVQAYDKARGRGGAAQAVKRFGVTFLTLRKWLEKSKSKNKPVKRAAKKPSRTRKRVVRIKVRRKKAAVVLKGSLRQKLDKGLAAIEKLEKEISRRQKAVQKEKQAIKKLLS